MKTKFIFTALTMLCLSAFIVSSVCAAQVPRLLNYQGKLTDKDSVPLEGTFAMTFRIYDAETAGNRLWEETQPAVIAQKGIFSVLLGSVVNLDLAFDKPYFLEVVVGSEVMNPRQRIVSAGYAISAEYGVPAGTMLIWPTDTAPYGYLLCDGRAIARATYAGLFSVIGTQYGAGDGSATFNLPNLNGRVVVGKDASDADFNALAKTGGEKSHTLTAAEMPPHSHSTAMYKGDGEGAAVRYSSSYSASYVGSLTTGSAGSGAAHNNLQPFTVLNYIIKY